ncbi:MAG: tetratricopeptide repeat protein [Deltaproteobacteria bacterium]|nr:tetratricopeptide repeat protein [Deltaproteobacteria bacterium]MDQ3298781.1 tetratricopeptide repeat protein [Myxococcota bacterium]
MTEETGSETEGTGGNQPQVVGGIKKKQLIIIGVITALVWAFAIQTGSTVLMIIVGVLTVALAAVLIWAFRMIRKQRRVVSLLQQGNQSPEGRRDALAKLNASKDANAPTNLFARAQLMAADSPKEALKLLESIELKVFPAPMQDDVSLLRAQLYLSFGRTQDARKAADSMNLDNPARKEIRPFAASICAEAWARTGKGKEALALLETIELPRENAESIGLQMRIARVFARFATNQRNQARSELVALADEDPNYLGRFVAPQFRVHPELQKLARSVIQQHPSARRQIKSQAR